MAIVARYSIKGGVGKTASAVNLAHIASRLGMRTLLWDLDPQGAASFYLRARLDRKFEQALLQDVKRLSRYIVPSAYSRLDVIPARFSNHRLEAMLGEHSANNKRLAKILYPLARNYELIILDCPPGVSNIAANALCASELILVPTIPTPLSTRTLRQLDKYARQLKCKAIIRPFFCMFDARRSTHKSIRDYYLNVHEDEMLQSIIPYSAVVERMGIARRPLTDYAWSSSPAVAYRNLFEEVQLELIEAEH